MSKWSRNLVSVVVASHRSSEFLIKLLQSLKPQTHKQLEIIAVLNCYCEKDKLDLKKMFPEVRYIHNRENAYYCKANNQGIRVSSGEFILCVNDDVEFESTFVGEMVNAAQKDKNIGMVSGYILRKDHKTVDTTGLFLGRSRRPIERGYGCNKEKVASKAGYVFGAGGVAALYRHNMLEEMKLKGECFDEAYGMFYEDLDVAWRVQRLGWKGYYTPLAIAYHVRGASSKQHKPRFAVLEKYNLAWLSRELKLKVIRNRYMTIIKNDTWGGFLLNLPWIFAYELQLWVYLLVFEPTTVKEFFKDLNFISVGLKKRKLLMEKIGVA